MSSDPLVTAFLRWSLARAALARGWWLVAALHLVGDASLTPAQLLVVGIAQSALVALAEVPSGAVADAGGRLRTLVVAHVVTGAGMACTGFTTSFPLLVVTQCAWGVGWAISSGSDAAWLTDELDDPDAVDRALADQGRADLMGVPVGIVLVAALAWVAGLTVAMAAAGLAMVGLAVVVGRWPETRVAPGHDGRLVSSALATFRRSVGTAGRDRTVALVLAATFLANGGAQGFGRLRERRLLGLGLPGSPAPIVWFAAMALAAAVAGTAAMGAVRAGVHRSDGARRAYVVASLVGAAGTLAFALAPTLGPAMAGAVLVAGVGQPITRVASTILVNRQVGSDVRATVLSLLSQAENAGEVVCGLALVAVVGGTSTTPLVASAVLVALAAAAVGRIRRR